MNKCCNWTKLYYCLEWPISQQTAKSKWTRADKRWITYKKFLLRTLDFIRFLVIYFSCVLVFWSSSQNHTNFSLFVQASTCAPDTVCKGWEEIGKEVANDENCPESLRCLCFFLHQKVFFFISGNCHSYGQELCIFRWLAVLWIQRCKEDVALWPPPAKVRWEPPIVFCHLGSYVSFSLVGPLHLRPLV